MYAKIFPKHVYKPMISCALNSEDKTLNLALLEPKVQKMKTIDDFKTT